MAYTLTRIIHSDRKQTIEGYKEDSDKKQFNEQKEQKENILINKNYRKKCYLKMTKFLKLSFGD